MSWRWYFASGLAALVCVVMIGGCSPAPTFTYRGDMEAARALRADSGANEETGEVAPVTEGWATIKGVFKFNGEVPAESFLSTGGKDSGTCGAQVVDQSLVVDASSMGLANVVVFARKVSRVHESAAEMTSAEKLFDQKACLFLTHVSTVLVGQTITIKNSDPVAHNTNIAPPVDKGTNPILGPDATAAYAFGKAQNAPVAVTCSIHPWMKSYILPRKDPYAAVSAMDGSFEIANLPAGEAIELQVWHEKKGGGFKVDRPELKWGGSGKFTVKLEPDQVLDLGEIIVDASAL